MSHSAEEIRRETFECLTTFGCRRSLDRRRGGEYQDFLSEIFCLTVPRNFVWKPYSMSLPSNAEEVWISEGGGSIKIFRRKIFCLTVPKILVREYFSVSLIPGMEKKFASEGYVTIFDFLSEFLVSQ